MPKLKEIAWDRVEESSNIHSLYYHEPHKVICVRFNSGGLYTYMGADMEMFMGLRHAQSVGRYLNNVVKSLPYTRWGSEAEMLAYLNVGK